jgi:hypothetical protein
MSDDTKNGGPTSGNHDRQGRFQPGNSARAESQRVRQRNTGIRIHQGTNSGRDLVDWMLEVAKDVTHRDRVKAIDWLWTRWAGKVPDKLEVTGEDGKPLNPLHGFTPEQLLALASAKTEGEK